MTMDIRDYLLEKTKKLTLVWGKDFGESKISHAWGKIQEKKRSISEGPRILGLRRGSQRGTRSMAVMGSW